MVNRGDRTRVSAGGAARICKPEEFTDAGGATVLSVSSLHEAVDALKRLSKPYLHNGQPHDYIPDFIIRLNTTPVLHLILETKGFDDLAEVKAGAAQRWVAAVNADGQFGRWAYEMARAMPKVRAVLDGYVERPT
jgi:hypothetical protein